MNKSTTIKNIIFLNCILLSFAVYADNASNGQVNAEIPINPLVLPPDDPSSSALCQQPGLTCVPVPQGAYWYQMFPDPQQREIVQRLNRTDISLSYRHWLAVPQDWKTFDYIAAAPFPDHLDTNGQKRLVVDLDKFAFAAYNEAGYMVYWGPASGGQDFCQDVQRPCQSATGSAHIYRVSANYISHSYPVDQGGGDAMPYAMFYYKGFAIHAAPLAGFINRSHGCIHLMTSDAKWVFENFASLGTEVVVKS